MTLRRNLSLYALLAAMSVACSNAAIVGGGKQQSQPQQLPKSEVEKGGKEEAAGSSDSATVPHDEDAERSDVPVWINGSYLTCAVESVGEGEDVDGDRRVGCGLVYGPSRPVEVDDKQRLDLKWRVVDGRNRDVPLVQQAGAPRRIERTFLVAPAAARDLAVTLEINGMPAAAKHRASLGKLLAEAKASEASSTEVGEDEALELDPKPAAAPAKVAPKANGLRFFVSKASFPSNLGGVAGADAKCGAAAASLGGVWMALLETPKQPLAPRLNAIAAVGVVDVQGNRVAENPIALLAGTHLRVANMAEDGTPVNGYAFTGSGNATDISALTTCQDYTYDGTGFAESLTGEAYSSGPDWFQKGTVACSTSAHLYCLEKEVSRAP